MVYAYDQWAQLPVKDIYDTQMMLAHVSQLKDMYEKAAQEMKDFKKEYGDFYSSRPADMDWYRNEYGKIKNTMDQLYAQGLDLRSPEFRSAMARARDSFDIAAFNERKKSAANYDIYLQNKAKLDAAGKYNPQMEDAIIRSLGLNDPNKIWDRLSPSIYQDQIEITDNIFNKMDDDFIETDKNGIDWYGVSRDRRTQALDAAIGDILNTPSGKFHYDQYKAAHPELNEADALAGFKNDLLNMSNKYEHRKGVENPIIKRQRDIDADINAYNRKASIDVWKYKETHKNTPGYDENGNPIGNNNPLNFTQQQVWNVKSKQNNIGTGKTVQKAGVEFLKANRKYKQIANPTESDKLEQINAAIIYMKSLKQHFSANVNSPFGIKAFLGREENLEQIPETRVTGTKVVFSGTNRFNLEAVRLSNATPVLRLPNSLQKLNNLIKQSGAVGYILENRSTSDVYNDGTVDMVMPISIKQSDIVRILGRDLYQYEKQLLGITESSLMPDIKRKSSSAATEVLYGEQLYYNIPFARTISNDGGQTRGEIDMLYDRDIIGTSEASDNRLINQSKSAAGI